MKAGGRPVFPLGLGLGRGGGRGGTYYWVSDDGPNGQPGLNAPVMGRPVESTFLIACSTAHYRRRLVFSDKAEHVLQADLSVAVHVGLTNHLIDGLLILVLS